MISKIICPSTLVNKTRDKTYSTRCNLIVPAMMVMALSAVSVCRDLWCLWHSDTNFEGLMLVPVMCGLIFYKSREDFALCTPIPTKRALYVLPVVLGIMFITSNYGYPRIAGLLLVVNLLIASFGILGYSNYRLFAGPLIFLMLMVPPPLFVIDFITVNLQGLFSQMVEAIFLCCSDSYGGRYGCVFWFTELDHPLIIAPECSGIRSLLGFIIVSSLLAVFDRHSIVTTILMISAGVATALVLNFLRILATMQMRLSGLEEYSVGFWHGLLGIAVFMIGCLALNKLSKFSTPIAPKNHKEKK